MVAEQSDFFFYSQFFFFSKLVLHSLHISPENGVRREEGRGGLRGGTSMSQTDKL